MSVTTGRSVEFKDVGGPFDTRKHLAHAARQAQARNYSDFLIVDVDSHHYESDSWGEIFEYVEDPVVRQRLEATGGRFGRTAIAPVPIGDQDVVGRITSSQYRLDEVVEGSEQHKDVALSPATSTRWASTTR